MEICDGFDNDGDGQVDDGCACEVSATQDCFPRRALFEGCRTGTQQCVATAGGTAWSVCEGALVPLEGQTTCCSALTDMPEHAALDMFLAAYPFETMPSSHEAVLTFLPDTGELRMTTVVTSVADEFIDGGRGGVTIDNLAAGRDETLRSAMSELGIEDVDVLATREPEPMFDGGDGGCQRWGAAWGSLLYRTPEEGVDEVVYLYVGVCNDGDAEAFYRTEVSLEVCEDGTAPLI